jgi:hypothetical protein
VLGVQPFLAGARAFLCRGLEGGRDLVGRVCDVVVTPCDVHRLEMARPQTD